jgi:hypothetical protein
MNGIACNAHTNLNLIKHKILPYPLLIKQAQLTFMHSIYYIMHQIPSMMFGKKNSERNFELNLRNEDDLYILQSRTSF